MTLYLADRGKAPPIPERQPSPLNFSSNNPFRNRATSPNPASPQNASFPRPANTNNNMSKNPFLDASEITSSPTRENGDSKNGFSEDIFKDLSLLDKQQPESRPGGASMGNGEYDLNAAHSRLAPPQSHRSQPAGAMAHRAQPPLGAPLAAKNGPSARAGTLPLPPPGGHRPTGSEERRNYPPRPSRGPDSPSKREHRPRPRGMSESSVIDEKERRERRERHDRERGERPDRTESEERRRRERRREREERHRREKEKIRKGDGRPMKKPQGLDIIDKLDVTGIYGQGLFHHDGPFDACNPHRNAGKGRRPAPMQAFPADSANMALGGAGPNRSRLDLDKFHGRGEEGFSDYAVTRKATTANIINPTDRIEQVHGNETHGLGTSTFLEGAPASRRALERRESEDQSMQAQQGLQPDGGMGMGGGGGGLARKKSLVQRFRGMSASRGKYGPNGAEGMRSPDARYNNASDLLGDSPPQATAGGSGKAISAGGPMRARYNKENEVNPFFDNNAYDDAFEKKGAQIQIAEQERPSAAAGRSGTATSPKGAGGGGLGLVRSVTADSAAVRGSSNEEDRPSGNGGGGGFLSRMRSLKGGGRRARPERRDT